MSMNKNANLRQTTEAEIAQDIFGYDEITVNATERVVDEPLAEPIAGPSEEPSASTSVQKVIIETCTQLQKHMKTLMGVVGADKDNTEEDTVELMPKSGVRMNEIQVILITKKWKANPAEVTRQLLLVIYGKDTLKTMSTTGKGGRVGVPENVRDAIFYHICTRYSVKLTKVKFINKITKFCNDLRNPRDRRRKNLAEKTSENDSSENLNLIRENETSEPARMNVVNVPVLKEVGEREKGMSEVNKRKLIDNGMNESVRMNGKRLKKKRMNDKRERMKEKGDMILSEDERMVMNGIEERWEK